MKEFIELNPKLINSVAVFFIGILGDYILTKFGIIVPESVKTFFILLLTALIARYSRNLFTNVNQKNDFNIYNANKKMTN